MNSGCLETGLFKWCQYLFNITITVLQIEHDDMKHYTCSCV